MTTQPSDPLAAERENERREEIALAPCPFCGPESDLVFSQPCSGGGFGVTCRNCHTNMDVRSLDRDSVVAAWNRRALPPLLQQGEAVAWLGVCVDGNVSVTTEADTRDRWAQMGRAITPLGAIAPRPAEAQARAAALHPSTRNLVDRFASALAEKLAKAEAKYGYTDGWLSANWEADCREAFLGHIEKGDPRDVAAYCAFMWHHGWSTSAGSTPKPAGVEEQS